MLLLPEVVAEVADIVLHLEEAVVAVVVQPEVQEGVNIQYFKLVQFEIHEILVFDPLCNLYFIPF